MRQIIFLQRPEEVYREKYEKSRLPSQSRYVYHPEIPVLGLVAEELHSRESAECSAEEAEAEESCLLGAPFPLFRLYLVSLVEYQRYQRHHREKCGCSDK